MTLISVGSLSFEVDRTAFVLLKPTLMLGLALFAISPAKGSASCAETAFRTPSRTSQTLPASSRPLTEGSFIQSHDKLNSLPHEVLEDKFKQLIKLFNSRYQTGLSPEQRKEQIRLYLSTLSDHEAAFLALHNDLKLGSNPFSPIHTTSTETKSMSSKAWSQNFNPSSQT